MKEKQKIGEFLKNEINRSKVKKAEIILTCEVNASTFYRILSGESMPSKAMLKAIIRAVNKLTAAESINETLALEIAGYKSDEVSETVAHIGTGIKAVFRTHDFTAEEVKKISQAFEVALAAVTQRTDSKINKAKKKTVNSENL